MYDKIAFYHEILSPKLGEIFEICKAEGIPFFAATVTCIDRDKTQIFTTQVVEGLDELPGSFLATLELFGNPEYAKVCEEILEMQLLRAVLEGQTASAGATIQ